MTYEETAIVDLLQTSPDTAYSRREIARRAVKRRVFEENPRWAEGPLDALVGRGIIEINNGGQYQLKPQRGRT